jgi:hypothetical protein
VEQAAFTGLVFGMIFAITTRIWLLMVAHAAFDVTAVAITYWNLGRRSLTCSSSSRNRAQSG